MGRLLLRSHSKLGWLQVAQKAKDLDKGFWERRSPVKFKKYVVYFSLVALSEVKILIIQILLLNLTCKNKNVKVIKEKIKR